jgi:hypothetical protein
MFSHKEQRQFREYKLDSLLDFSMDLKLMVFTKSTRSKRLCDSNGAPYFADQRPEMFVLLIKIKMEQSMIKTKYIWAILIQISN